MADWDALAADAGVAPAEMPKAQKAPEKQKVSYQPLRFAGDVAARAAGVFAGWPADTAANLINLGIAGYGTLKGGLGSTDLPEIIQNHVGGSQQITQGYRNILAEAAGSPPGGVQPQYPGQEFLGNVGELTGGALVGGVPSTYGQAARVAGSVFGTEAGRQAATAISPNSTVAPIIGQLAGGVAVPSMVQGRGQGAQALYQAGKNALGGAQAQAVPVAENIIGKNVRAAVQGDPNAAANITEALRLQGVIPGVTLSTAEMTGNPSLATMQSRYSALSPANTNAELARQAANKTALSDAMQNRMPDGSASPNEPRNAVNRSLAEQGTTVAEKQGALSGSLTNTSQREAGQNLLDIANAERQTAKTKVVQPAYKKAFDAAGDAKIDVTNVLSDAEKILGRKLSEFAPETAPNTVRALRSFEPAKDKWAEIFGEPVSVPEGTPKPKPEATLQQLDDVRKAINADIQQAKVSMSPTADMTLRNLKKLHGAIDSAVSESATLSDTAKTAYSDALNTYREQYVPRFKEGVNANLYRKTSLNEQRLNPDDVVSTYFQPGGEREAGQFVKLFGKNPEAIQQAKGGIEDLYRQSVVDPQTGNIDPAAHARFMAQHSRQIAIMDKAGMGIGERLANVGQTAQELQVVQKTLAQKAAQLKYDTVGDMQAAVLSSPMKMGMALREMDRPGKAALARSILEEAWQPVKNGDTESGAKMLDHLVKNERTIKMAMSAAEGSQVAQKHFSDIQDIAKTVQMIEAANVRGKMAPGIGNDPLKAATGVSIPTIWSQTRAVMQGRQGVGTAVAMISGPVLTRLSQVQFDAVMNRALHDPQTAVALRDFLNSSPAQANAKGAGLLHVLDVAKTMATKAPRLLAKYWIGTPNYGPNAATIAPVLAKEGANSVSDNQNAAQ